MRYLIAVVLLSGSLSVFAQHLPIAISTELSGASGSHRIYTIEVSDAVRELRVETRGGTGDCDLYLRRDAAPTLTRYDYRSFVKGTTESIRLSNPPRGVWHIMLRGTARYDRVTLTARMDQTSHFTERRQWMTPPTGWVNQSQTPATPAGAGYGLAGGQLLFKTRGKSDDRFKVRQQQTYGAGTYSWTVDVQRPTETATTTIGAFLLANGHEIDIEIAPGKTAERGAAKIRDDQLFAYCVVHTGGRGRLVKQIPIGAGRRTVSITLTPEAGQYRVSWNIAGIVVRDSVRSGISTSVGFWPVCSLENLPVSSGHGDFRAQLDHEVRFESFTYTPAP